MIDGDNKYVKIYREIVGCTDEEIERIKESNLNFINIYTDLKEIFKNRLSSSEPLTDADKDDLLRRIAGIDRTINEVAEDLYSPFPGVADTLALHERLYKLPKDKLKQYHYAMEGYFVEYYRKYPIEGISLEMMRYGDLDEILSIIRNKKN